MAVLRSYSNSFLKFLRPFGRPYIESILYESLKTTGILKSPRGVRAGIGMKERTSTRYRHHIDTVISNHRRASLFKGSGHSAANCIKIPTGTKASPTLPTYFLSNACHITNKVDELQVVVEANNANVAVITESWLHDNIPSTAVSIGHSFNVFRRDRTTSGGGGVLTYVHNTLPTKHLANLEVEDKEVLWLLHTPSRTVRPFSCIITVALYYPEFRKNVTKEKEISDYITERLDNLLKERPSAGIVITGDFNHLDPRQLCQRFGLRKIVKNPTRGKNILDQFLTNMSHFYGEAQHLPPLGRSDHQCIVYKPLKERPHNKAITRSVRKLKADNIRALGHKLNTENWDSVLEAGDVDEKVKAFNNIIIETLNTCAPLKQVRVHPSDKEWMTPYIKVQIRARQRAFTKGDKARFQLLCVKVADLITNAKSKFYQTKASELRCTNPSKWYKSIFSLCGAQKQSTTPTAPTKNDLQNVADQLLQTFTAPWVNREPTALSVSVLSESLEDRLPPVPNIGQVKAALKHLNSRKATGCDGVPAWLLKKFHEELAPVVHDIICASIQQCKYPTAYKHALISPIPKVNNPTDINNDYRQISVLPQVAKVLEKFQLTFNRKDLDIRATQHAFTEKRSTVTALANVTQDWFDATEPGSPYCGVHVLFVDFRKAFDLVDHATLLEKLADMGVSKSFWLWTQSYLSGRTQQVKLPGVLSRSSAVIAGVPQGGVISPTLFNVLINDIEDCTPPELAVSTCKYADDCTQYEMVSSDSSSHMQEVINNLEAWAVSNKMELNATKTKDMWISFKRTCSVPEPVSVGGKHLQRVDEFKLLGINVQNDLKWNAHVNDILKRAGKRMYFLRVCRKANLPKEIGLTTYLTKIRPLLEYASPIWGSLPAYLAADLQRVQNRSLDIIGLPRDTLQSLSARREDLTAKTFKNIVDSDPGHPCKRFLKTAKKHSYELRSSNTMRVPMSHTKRHQSSFFARGARIFNQVF